MVGAIAAVLFDMDGTLVDSERLWDVALRELAGRYGGVLSVDARRAMVGTSVARTMEILHTDVGQPWRDPVAGAVWLDARMAELFAMSLEWRPGARELLASVRAAGLPVALVTSTQRALTEICLRTIGRHHFDVVVCGDEVARTKPDPEPYLSAAAALGVDPRRCVAVEDSPSGVASAVAAGCVVVGVPSVAPLPAAGVGLVVESLLGVDLAMLAGLLA